MPGRIASYSPVMRRLARDAALLAGVSAVALLLAAPHAAARPFGGRALDPSASAVAAVQSGGQEAGRIARAVQDSLRRAAAAIQAMRIAQQAARNAAQSQPGTTPNGLQTGGLQVAPDAAPGSNLWQGANLPAELAAGGRTRVRIEQTQKQAILTWRTFNIGKETDVYFDQRAGGGTANEWIVLNRVVDSSLAPSRILGSIKAEGQAYVINQNGIIFGGTSQINVGTLIASSLGITDEQFRYGILYQADTSFGKAVPAFIGTPGHTKAVMVEAGAEIVTQYGGKVLLLGGKVTNAGSIATPQGQTILAAGDRVWLEQNTAKESGGVRGIVANVDNGIIGAPPAHPECSYCIDYATDSFIRGHLGSGGTATNTGMITVPQGDITLVGQHVTQGGVLEATTSATLNGSIKLWARSDEGAANFGYYYGGMRGVFGGNLSLTEGSLTQVAIDTGASDTLLDAGLFKPSSIDMVGKTIVLGRNVSVLAPGGVVNVRAGDVTIPGDLVGTNGQGSGLGKYPDDGSRIYLDAGSVIDVSGLQGVAVPMERNTIKAELRGDEFADFPQLRNGPLRGKTIYADRRVTGTREDGSTWIGTPYGNINGWAGLVAYKADELATKAGSVRLESRGDVVTRDTSSVFAEGGSVAYQAGVVRSTKVVWQGRYYDISQLTPEMTGATLARGFTRAHDRWGFIDIWSNPLRDATGGHFETGYTEGRSGGSIVTTGYRAVLDGGLFVGAGPTDAPRGNAGVPAGGTLTFGGVYPNAAVPTRPIPNVAIGAAPARLGDGFSADSALPADLASTLYLRPELLSGSGAKDVTVNTAKDFSIGAGTSITLAPNGSLTVSGAASARIDGNIRIVSGDVTIQAGSVTMGSGSSIDVSGLWVNLASAPADAQPVYDRAWLDGGNVALEAIGAYGSGALRFPAGSLIDVSSGGLMLANGRMAMGSGGLPLGNGGSISLIGNQVLSANAGDYPGGVLKSAPIVIAGDLRGYGFGRGGKLAVSANTIQIGGDPSLTNSEMYLTPDFFRSRGFSDYRLVGWRGVMLAPGTVLKPRAQNFVVDNETVRIATGTRLSDVAHIGVLPDYLRSPTSVALHAPDYADSRPEAQTYVPGQWGIAGDIILGKGSAIRTDPGATVDIRAARQLSVLGDIIAPGGKITLGNELESGIPVNVLPSPLYAIRPRRTNVSLWVDSGATVSAAGLVQNYLNPTTGLKQAKVYDGGSIMLTGNNVIVQRGSILDVSGAAGFDEVIPRSGVYQRVGVIPRPVASNAGRIDVSAQNYLYFDPELRVRAGSPEMRGASFSFSSFFIYSNTLRLRDRPQGAPEVANIGDLMTSGLSIFPDSLNSAGFDDLSFGKFQAVLFENDLTLTARRSIRFANTFFYGGADIAATLNAPYVSFGEYYFFPPSPPSSPSGTLSVNADLVDFNESTIFSGFKTVTFNSSGDIRFFGSGDGAAGSLNVSDELVFRAAQIYPVTGGYFNVTARPSNPNSRITVLSNGNPAKVPLSAGGRLTLQAAHIAQNGVVRAPAGQITLTNSIRPVAGADIVLGPGSITSVDLDGALIPYGQTANDMDWVYPFSGGTIRPKQITFTGPTINIKAGALVTASGGGDLATFEFVPGPGGSRDILAGSNVFAVIPGYSGPLPSDLSWGQVPASWGQGTSLTIGNSVYLSGIPGLAAGMYTLLPGHYALLPGGYRVVVNKLNNDFMARPSFQTANGSYFVSGYLTDQFSGARFSSNWSTFLVSSGSVVRSQTEYKEYGLSNFLTQVAAAAGQVPVRLPTEPGRIQINATSLLTFEGAMRTTPVAGGRGGQIDISTGGNILITGSQSAPIAGTLVMRADQLNQLETESLYIGGARSQTDAFGNVLQGASVTVNATNITIDTQGETLSGTEIIFAAKTGITAKSGSILVASGEYRSAASPDLVLDRAGSGGAVLAFGNGAKTSFRRNTAATGNIVVESGVVLHGGNTVLFDAANINLPFGTGSALSGRSVQIGVNHISLGDTQHATTPPRPGLTLDLAAVADLSRIVDLTLRSRQSIDLYGNFTLGLGAPGTAVAFDAAGLVGVGAPGQAATVNAGTVSFVNSAGVTASAGQLPPAGSGALRVNAEGVNLGGNFFLAGTTDTRLLATGTVSSTSSSSGLFDVRGGSLTLQGARITAAPLVSRVIQAPGAITVLASANPTGSPIVNAGGARLQLIGSSIVQDGNIELPGGVIVLQAAGDVAFGNHSITNASGFAKTFFDQTRYSPAGRIDVVSGGNVRVAAGALIDLSSPGDAGTFTVSAAAGTFDMQGTFKGAGGRGYLNAAFTLDAGSVADFDRISTILNAARFDRERQVRVRDGDIAIGSEIRARTVAVSADNGRITVSSRIDASGPTAGDIRLSASGDVVLTGNAVLDVQGDKLDAARKGGSIALESASGVIDMQSGSRLALGTAGDTGTLHVRVARAGDGIAAGTHLRGILSGVGAINIEAVKVYDGVTALGSGGSGPGALTFAAIDADNSAFIAAAAAGIRARLATDVAAANVGFDAARLHVTPGAEVRSSGDLTVTNAGAVNLADYRYGGEAGVLTLRAAANLAINGNLSDGFTTALAATGHLLTLNDANGAASWSYRLVGGADLGAADVRSATQPGDVVVAAGTLVRTGTGDIDVRAGRDARFAARDSVVYTAGVGRDTAGLNVPLDVSFAGRRVAYGINGGDITVSAGGNISQAPSEELISAWLYRQGDRDLQGNVIPGRTTSWWIDYTQYQQGGVGALGGGNITVIAGNPRNEASGNINNLSVMLPTTGLYQNEVEVFTNGGGMMTVGATGNINSGIFYVGKGTGDLRTSRSFGSGRIVRDTNPSAPLWSTPIYPVLALGDGTFNLVGGGNATLHSIFNPTATLQVERNGDGGFTPWSTFFTYTDRSAVTLTAVGGTASIGGDIAALWQTANSGSPQFTSAAQNARYIGIRLQGDSNPQIDIRSLLAYAVTPPTLAVAALNGNISVNSSTSAATMISPTLFPASRGTLELLSAGGISGMANISDADPLRLPRAGAPAQNFIDASQRLTETWVDFTQDNDVSRERLHAVVPLHKSDVTPARIYAAGGDISFTLSSAKPAWLWAQRDIRDVNLLVQNVDPTDLTLIRAGRDIRFSRSTYNALGQVTVAGPGRLALEAERHIDLGSSAQGIQTIGNLRNPNLAQDGAAVLLAAGMTDVHYAEFARTYFDPAAFGGLYDQVLVAYMRERSAGTGDLTPLEAWALFQILPREQQAPLIRSVLYAEVRAAADEAARSGGTNVERYARGFRAIHTLFPEDAARIGDIRMFSSQVLTRDGGDVELLAPGGSLILGLTQSTQQAQQGLGIQAQRTGSIYSMSYGDVIINRAAVQTLDGGDIVMWSTTGNIDAGKGAKTRRQIAVPRFRTDSYGTLQRDPGSASTGAGIATQQAILGAKPGSVILATPNGYVDAGDAGIRAAGNIAVAAYLGVRNADNIQAGGAATGVSIIVPNMSKALTAASNATVATQQAGIPTQAETREQPSIITVEFLGFGGMTDDQGPADDSQRTPGRRSNNTYDPRGMLRVLGNGPMTAAQLQELTAEERQKLSGQTGR